MVNPAIDTTQLAKLARVFSVDTRKKILTAAGKRMGVAAESVVPPYPPASGKPLPKIYNRQRKDGSSYLSKFKNAAMQGAVFALVNAGKIPYKRTGMLGRSITSGIADLTGSSVTVKIGSALKFAPLVIGDDTQQAPYHKGTWWQLNVVMTDNTKKIEGEGQAALNAEVQREINGLTR